MLREANYSIAPRGRATSFTESELPVEFCLEMRNRFINSAGGAEKRQGIVQLGNTVAGSPTLNKMHELVLPDGSAVLFTSGVGTLWREDGSSWTEVKSGLDTTVKLRSVQMDDKLIFYNGIDRNFFTEDGMEFKELRAIVERGDAETATGTTQIVDTDVENWVTNSDAAVNDLVYNITAGGYGVVTALASATATHTTISTVATGLGAATNGNPAPGDRYELIDLVELNIIPTDGEDDNTAIAGTGTGATTIAVSGVNFSTTDVRIGDYVRNTTRSAVMQVSAIATALTVTSVASQTNGDSLVFLKSAMPFTERAHVHFGRLYMVDARDRRKTRISGGGNPEDMTTDAGTLDSSTVKFGALQPQGDYVLSMSSYQRFLILAGKRNLFAFEGTEPIADTSADSTDFDVVGLFPQGIVSPDSLLSIGNDMTFVSQDGIQSISMVADASTLGRANLSEAIKTTLRDSLAAASEDDIQAFHYPTRSWLCLKVGSEIHVLNYTAFFGQDRTQGQSVLAPLEGSWSIFDGKFARQNDYFVRQDGTLLCCGAGGKVYAFDQDTYDDDGDAIPTEYKTGWLTLDEPKRRVKTRQIHYIKPIIIAGGDITYTARAEGNFDVDSSDQAMITASSASQPIGTFTIGDDQIGGAGIKNVKYPLRVRGEQVRITFTTEDDKGPDTLSRFTLYATVWGKK